MTNICDRTQTTKKAKIWYVVTWFKRGYGAWVSFVIAMLNFVVIQYQLLVKTVPVLEALFTSAIAFGVFFVAVIVPITVLIGWWDYKKGSMPVENAACVESNPWTWDLAKALSLICDGKNAEAKTLLGKWVPKEMQDAK